MSLAPIEFTKLGLDTARFKQAMVGEWHGPCPRCGGKDRFIVHCRDDFPHWFLWCREGRGCGWRGWADQLEPSLKSIGEDDRKRWAEKRRQAELQAQQKKQRLLKKFTDGELWHELYRRASQQAQQWWMEQGLPLQAQYYWMLGEGETLGGFPAYSIPYFQDGKIVNLQWRLKVSPANGDKYRWYGLGYSSYFSCYNGEYPQAVICEGAKKAMVFAWHIAQEKIQVYGIPSKSDFAGIEKIAAKHKRLYIMLDPDAQHESRKLAGIIGNHSIVITLPDKADDMVLQGYGPEYFRAIFKKAAA